MLVWWKHYKSMCGAWGNNRRFKIYKIASAWHISRVSLCAIAKMNRGRKGGFNSKFNEDIPDELRCKRSDGKQWRCNARAMENKTLCEKHYNQAKKRVAGVSSPSSTFSPKKKLKRKEEPKATRTSNRDVEVRSKSSRIMTTDSSDYRYSNDSQYASEYRSFGDYSHVSDYQSAGFLQP